jgi:hypothetical protein
MKVICISGSKFLEEHKIYKVIDIDDDSYCLEISWPGADGIMQKGWFHKMNFETLEDNRERKIEKILEKDKTRE